MSSGSVTPATRTLSEAESKALLRNHGIPFADEREVADADGAVGAARQLGFPVVVKLNGPTIAHKTERALVRLRLGDESAVRAAATELLAAARPDDGAVSLLVAPMLVATRELLAGVARDPQFGPTVVVGLGGVLTEALSDVSVRLAPIDRATAEDMLDTLAHRVLLGPFRGEPPVDRSAMCDLLIALSDLAVAEPSIVSVDCNPVLIVDGLPVAVDALVEVGP
jgi:acetyl-CoA synthetase (ADP-forming)